MSDANVINIAQELLKYLRGYHACPVKETAYLAALIYRAMHGDDATHLVNFPYVVTVVLSRACVCACVSTSIIDLLYYYCL